MNIFLEQQMKSTNLVDLSKLENLNIAGGGFAYDAGFFLREVVIYMGSGMGAGGAGAVALDLSLNYQPVR